MATMAKQNTSIELKIQALLNEKGIQFFTHVPLLYWNADIVLSDSKVAIFCDGCYWHGCVLHRKKRPAKPQDKAAVTYLTSRGWQVVRLWEHEINSNPSGCLEKIKEAISKSDKTQTLWPYTKEAVAV